VAVMAEAIALYATHDAPEEPRVSSIAPPQPQPDAETSAAEVSMTGTDGARILSFPAPVFGRQSNVDAESVTTGSSDHFATGSTAPTSVDLFTLTTLKKTRLWRPVKFTRNPDYPKVILEGCDFKQDSGGFALRQKQPSKYLGHYRRDTIAELEKKYGAKKPRKRKDRT